LVNCLLYLSSIILQFLDFIHWMVFDFIFYYVTMHTLYRYLVIIDEIQGLSLCSIQITNLRTFLQNTSVATPCCDSLIPMKNCCTGVVECPECNWEYRFSWCSRDLCDEDNRPRNHCSICQTCRDYRDQHCPVSDRICQW